LKDAPAILVAIDMIGGEVVRLRQGDYDEKATYSADPVETALKWERAGAEWLHLVDLDGAYGAGRNNRPVIREIISAVGIPVEIGGGIRTFDEADRWLSNGAERICIGTALMQPEFLSRAPARYGGQLVASVDSRAGMVRTRGWRESSGEPTETVVRNLVAAGVGRIMFTDIERDGMLGGPNVSEVERVLEWAGVPVIAAGGVTTAKDVAGLAGLAFKGLEGIVIGKALYSGKLSLKQALAAARRTR
jgi:phosphoribosylformimino-5-aminoimidazole carboxamide ribotide isomerase